ncbi:MAG: hypothetical protein KatS3mg129_2419 [Leptospiraceae bacterium]|nr:MAG: hypothetical protein KatS3mg129_2419 [Leptospiraceae bacterium]
MILKTNKILIFTLILISFGCSKKEEIDIKEYENVCKKVAQCDNQFKKFQDLEKHCISFFVKLKKSKSESLNSILECIKSSPCETLSFQNCTIEHIKELQNMKPATKMD